MCPAVRTLLYRLSTYISESTTCCAYHHMVLLIFLVMVQYLPQNTVAIVAEVMTPHTLYSSTVLPHWFGMKISVLFDHIPGITTTIFIQQSCYF